MENMKHSFKRNVCPGRIVGDHLSTSSHTNIEVTQCVKTHGISYCMVKYCKCEGRIQRFSSSNYGLV